jgi:hypothetical protein
LKVVGVLEYLVQQVADLGENTGLIVDIVK